MQQWRARPREDGRMSQKGNRLLAVEREMEMGDGLRAIEPQMAGIEATVTKLATVLDQSSERQATPMGVQGRGKSWESQ